MAQNRSSETNAALAQGTGGVGSADVARAHAAQIDPLEVRDDQAKGNRAKEIGQKERDCDRHRLVLITLSPEVGEPMSQRRLARVGL
jgi:hypothetical protein